MKIKHIIEAVTARYQLFWVLAIDLISGMCTPVFGKATRMVRASDTAEPHMSFWLILTVNCIYAPKSYFSVI